MISLAAIAIFFAWLMGWLDKIKNIAKTLPEIPGVFETALFFRHKTRSWQGTWSYLADSIDEDWRNQCLDAMRERGANCITVLTNNSDPSEPVSIFKDRKFGGEVDKTRLARMVKECERLVYDERLHIFATLFCDDDAGEANGGMVEEYFRQIHNAIGHLKPYYVISIESNEILTPDKCTRLAALMRGISGRPVGTHAANDFDRPYFPGGLDFLLVEASWNPHNGQNISPRKCIEEYTWARTHFGKPVFWHEWIVEGMDAPICEQQREAVMGQNPYGVG